MGVFYDRERNQVVVSTGCAIIAVAILVAILVIVEIVDWA